MNERSRAISRLLSNLDARASYIKAKLGVLVPSQIKALRIRSNMTRQSDLARMAKMHQSRISMFETPGAANLTLDTLSRLAAAFKVGLVVEFVPFSEMLGWENGFSQDSFDVVRIDRDKDFIRGTSRIARRGRRKRTITAGLMPAVVRSQGMELEHFPTGIQNCFDFGPSVEMPSGKGEISWLPKPQIPGSPYSKISEQMISRPHTQTTSSLNRAFGT